MKHKRIRITREMIRRHFGASARITSFLGRYTVKTPRGGECKITQRNINPICGGSDVYRASVLLANEAWGGGKVNGPPDFKMAALAHAEFEGVDMRVKERGGFARAVICAVIAWIGIAFTSPGNPWPGLCSCFIAGLLWLLLKRAAKRMAQYETDQMSNRYPRTGGDAHEASDEDLKKGDWI